MTAINLMRNGIILGLISIVLLAINSCSSISTRNAVLRDITLGAVAGAILAQSRSENKDAYTLMYAGIGGATAGALSAIINIPDEDQLKKENEKLKEQVLKFQKQMQPQLIQQGNSLFSSPIPKEVSSLVEPGEWKRYKLDQWVQDPNQQNTWFRQVEMFEIIPPVAK